MRFGLVSALASALTVTIAMIAPTAGAELFRCADPEGRLRYTDKASDCDITHPVRIERNRNRPCDDPPGCAPPASATSDTQSVRRADLASSFLPHGELSPEWGLVDEAPEPIDPELRRYGLIDTATRHYSRSRGRVSEICSVELWQFERAGSAGRVASSLTMPNWQVLRAESLLVLAHGVRLELSAGSDTSLQLACAELGRLTHEHIARKDPLGRH